MLYCIMAEVFCSKYKKGVVVDWEKFFCEKCGIGDEKKKRSFASKKGPLCQSAFRREAVCQWIALLPLWRKVLFMLQYPQIILPYLCRIQSASETNVT
jgi:hypothetical protein